MILRKIFSVSNTVNNENKHFKLVYFLGYKFLIQNKKEEKIQTNNECKRVSVIVPIYNALEETSALINSLYENFDFTKGEVILINDCSNDDMKYYLRKIVLKHTQFKLYENDTNIGFIKTCNKGIKIASGDVIVLLNSDTEIPKGFCEKILKCFNKNPKVGTASPISSNSYAYYIPLSNNLNIDRMNQLLEKRHKVTYPRLCLPEGFCFCIRKSLIEQIGYLDESYGKGYCEENDFSLRALKSGWQNCLIDNLYVKHRRHASFGTNVRNILLEENKKIYNKKWADFQKKYILENNIINPIESIKEDIFPTYVNINLSFLEKIFSVKNSKSGKYKIITIIGFHFKVLYRR